MKNKWFVKLLMAIVVMSVSVSAYARTDRKPSAKVVPARYLTIDSVSYRKDLTRVYGKIMGPPHTSMKIDKITGATDIDGIDFERWFQFEDNGVIPIEIDFGPIKKQSKLDFIVYSTKGEITCHIPVSKSSRK